MIIKLFIPIEIRFKQLVITFGSTATGYPVFTTQEVIIPEYCCRVQVQCGYHDSAPYNIHCNKTAHVIRPLIGIAQVVSKSKGSFAFAVKTPRKTELFASSVALSIMDTGLKYPPREKFS